MLRTDDHGGFEGYAPKSVQKKPDTFRAKSRKSNLKNTMMALKGMSQTGYTGKSKTKSVPGMKLNLFKGR
jgi:hypothetical protein